MGEMSKTPEEIKKGLELCVNANSCNYPCDECPYEKEEEGCKSMMEDAFALIQQLEIRNGAIEKSLDEVFVLNDKQASIIRSLNSNNSQARKALQDNGFGSLEELLQAFSQVKRERDAAVKILTDIVHITEWFGDIDICAACKKDNCKECRWCNEGFEWRGVPEGD